MPIIQGDNLQVLKTLKRESYGLIYIDPPYNTGNVQRRGKLRYVDTFSNFEE